jgi:hypothetical protein
MKEGPWRQKCRGSRKSQYGPEPGRQAINNETNTRPQNILAHKCYETNKEGDVRGSTMNQVPVAHTDNPCYLEGWDWEDCGSRPAWANSLRDPISKIIRAKGTGAVAQVLKHLLSKYKVLSSNPSLSLEKGERGQKWLERKITFF